MKKTIRFALVDDHALFREGLKDLLLDQPDFEIAAEGGDGKDALGAVAMVQMDVLLIDLRLPRLGGVAAIRQIRKTRPDLKIVVVSMFEDDDHKREAVAAGADAYHSKMDEAKAIVKTIRDLMAGKPMFDEKTVFRFRAEQAALDAASGTAPLTDTEHRVLELLARGGNNRDLALSLAISESTLKNHLNAIFRKLGAKSRVEALRRAMEKNLISLPV